MTVLFLAPSCAFIDADLSVRPNVYFVGGGVDDRIPYLRYPMCIPFAKGVVKLPFPGGRVASA
jgi:hypothetical protein